MNGLLVDSRKSPAEIFNEDGILYYPRLFEGDELARLREACEDVRDQFFAETDATDPENRNTIVMRGVINPRWHQQHDRHWKTLMAAVADARCLGPMRQIFRAEPYFLNSSLFFNPRFESFEGTWHRDIQFLLEDDEEKVKQALDSRTPVPNGMAGVQFQIALIDNDDVEYVPYSAGRYDSPEEYYYRVADNHAHNQEAGMPNALRLPQKAGDAIVFNPNGLHRGRYYVDNPRLTLMITYTPPSNPRHDSFGYQEWMLEPDVFAPLPRRTRAYFEH
jgi:ectoine hydroxylase-related dioxygenase (phytanoyl-CoA dioxygenase family)